MKILITSCILFILFLSSFTQKTSCDLILDSVGSNMNNFNTKFLSPNLPGLFNQLHSLRATILTTYLLCFNKSIIDPDSMYPQDISQCQMGLYNVSLLRDQYTGNPGKIKADVDRIAKILFMTENDCYPVMNYTGWSNVSLDCIDGSKTIDDLFQKYGQQIILGRNGTKYIQDMLLQAEKQRKLCGFNTILVKPKAWSADTCTKASNNWLYPLTDQLDTVLLSKDYKSYTAFFYMFYQSVYRAYNKCGSGSESEELVTLNLQRR